MSQPILFRDAEAGDLPFLADCARQAYQQYVAAIGKEPAPMNADFAHHLDAHRVTVMQDAEIKAGYAVWWVEDGYLYLDNIAILPQWQGKGLARQAMDFLEDQAQRHSAQAIRLYTNEKMLANLSLYPHLGFVETDRRAEHGFNRVFFEKRLH